MEMQPSQKGSRQKKLRQETFVSTDVCCSSFNILLKKKSKHQLLSHYSHYSPPVLELWPDMFKSLSSWTCKATHGQILIVGVCLCLCVKKEKESGFLKKRFASVSSVLLLKVVQRRVRKRRNRAAVCTVKQPGWRMQFIVKTNRPLSFFFFFSLHAAFPLSPLDAACRRLLLLLLSLSSFSFFFQSYSQAHLPAWFDRGLEIFFFFLVSVCALPAFKSAEKWRMEGLESEKPLL